ncbi:hypothetical protein BT69DRAFT_1288425 [Atractiella rhizophila]|nr:hypothetical protein BT69DRAFT_1288425 [Atractiella rhizophila]
MHKLTRMMPSNSNLNPQAGFWDEIIPTTDNLKYIMPQVLRYTHEPSHAHYMQGQEDRCGMGVCQGRRGSHGRGVLWLVGFDSDRV